MKTVVFVSLAALFALVACSPKPADLAKHYPVVYNSHDVDQIVSLYADDAVFEVVGQASFTGKEQILGVSRYDSVLNIHMTLSNVTSKGDTVWCDLTETNDWLKAAGIGDAHYKVVFVFENGLIKNLRAEALPETQKAFADVLVPLIEWTTENNPQALSEMMPEGKFIYNAENAGKSLELMRSWKSSQQ